MSVVDLLEGAFADRGAAVCAETGLGGSWPEVLATAPAGLLSGVTDAEAALERLRDGWATSALRPAFAVAKALVVVRGRRLGADAPDVLVDLAALGEIAGRAGLRAQADAALDRAWAVSRSSLGGNDLRVAVIAGHRASHRYRNGDLAEADAMLEAALRIRRAVAPGSVGPTVARLAEVRMAAGRPGDALPLLEEAWRGYRAALGPDDPRCRQRARTLAATAIAQGQPGRAVDALRDLLASARAADHADEVMGFAFELGIALVRLGRMEEGQRLADEALRLTRAVRPGPHPELPRRLNAWVEITLRRGRREEAEGLLLEALEAEKRLHGPTSFEVAVRYVQIAQFCREQGRHAEALGWLEPGATLVRAAAGDSSPATRHAVGLLVDVLAEEAVAANGRRDRVLAEQLAERALSVGSPVLGADAPAVRKLRELVRQLGTRSR